MRIHQSRLGGALAALYLVLVAVVAYEVSGCTNHSFPLVCDFTLALVILPALPLMALLDSFGVGEPVFRSPGPGASDVALLLLYAGVCAVLIYLVGYGVERAYRRVRARFRGADFETTPRMKEGE